MVYTGFGVQSKGESSGDGGESYGESGWAHTLERTGIGVGARSGGALIGEGGGRNEGDGSGDKGGV